LADRLQSHVAEISTNNKLAYEHLRMSDTPDPSRQLNPQDQAHAPFSRGPLRRIGDLFGFGLLDPRIMGYALGTFTCGLGAGLSIDALVRTRHLPADWLAWSGIGLMILGNVVGNMSHSSLKKATRRERELLHSGDAVSD